MQEQYYEGQVLVGTVATYYPGRGFGFVQPDGTRDNDVFVHISECADRSELKSGQRIEFTVDRDMRSGRLRATAVKVLEEKGEMQ